MIVYVETNFILEMAFLQRESEFCETITELVENGRISLVAPSFSIGESYETSYRRKKERESFVSDLRRRESQLSYSSEIHILENHIKTMIDILRESIVRDSNRLNVVLSRLAGGAEFISLSPSSLALAQEYQTTLRMEPPDSLVLGSVMTHLSETNPDVCCFLNKNSKDFEAPSVRNELRAYNCRLITSFEQGLNFIFSTLGD